MRRRGTHKDGTPYAVGSMPFGDVVAIFQPGIQHLVEEQERQRLEIVQPEDGDPPWEIDLDAGTALLGRPAPAADPGATGPGATAPDEAEPASEAEPPADGGDTA